MGVKCQIEKKENKIERVTAPNGEPSVLYESAKQLLGDEERALEVWAKAYTSDFLDYYGHWNAPAPGELFNTDSNGEPMLEDVIAYMRRQYYVADPFTAQDVKDVRDIMISNRIYSIRSLSNTVLRSFYVDGNLILNEQNLRDSGLYDETEISRILDNPSVLNEVVSSMRLLIDYSNNKHDMQKETYFTTVERPYGPVVYKRGVFNRFGKKVPYNPAELYEAMRNAIGGIKSVSAFESAFESLSDSYPELVERFVSDKSFALSIFKEFSNMKSMPVVAIEDDNVVESKRRSLSRLQDFSYYSPINAESLRARISAFLNRVNADTEEDLRSMIWDVEEACVGLGIDIVGVSKAYDGTEESLNKIDSLMLDLDIYVARRNDDTYAPTLASAIDDVLGDSRDRRVMFLPEYMDNMNIVYMESDIDPVSAFENHSLLYLGGNLYHKVEKDNLGDLYDMAAELAKQSLTYFPPGIYPEYCFKDGVLDKRRVENVDSKVLADSIKKYVLSYTDSRNTEEMNATRLAFGHLVVPGSPYVNEEREFSRYINRKQDSENPLLLFDLYQSYLENKLHNTEVYEGAYKYLDFKPDHLLGLTVSDPDTLKQIELSLAGNDREQLFEYSMSSTDPSFTDLFYLDYYDMLYAGSDFYHDLFTKHPNLLNEVRDHNITEQDGNVVVEGMYDGFIRIRNTVFTKVGESSSGSIYQNLTGTESEVKYDSTQKAKPTNIDYAPYENRSGLTQDMVAGREDMERLNRLECK